MKKGTLYIVASPIGNLEDITFRAVRILKDEAGAIFCEDTRQSKKLLERYGITTRPSSLHSHSSDKKIRDIIALLDSGTSAAYLTDSGTPGISDPGNKLVAWARSAGIRIEPIPGPSALSAILSVSGFTGKNVHFLGFLSKKSGRRLNELNSAREMQGIIVLYESPHRIKKLLEDVYQVFPNCEILIAREMTKVFEEFIHVSGHELPALIDNIKEKGEFTVAIMNK